MAENTYSNQFIRQGRAKEYDSGQYAPQSYSNLLWEIEKDFLKRVLAGFGRSARAIDYLDFACGTGRVISFVENYVNSSTGVDVSQDMLDRARQRVRRSKLLCADLTRVSKAVEEKFDLITAFRFFLNAERHLRLSAMRALASRLRDSESRLIFNNHGNPLSHKIGMWPFHTLRRLGQGYQTAGNYLTHGEVLYVLSALGLVVTESYGYGYLSARAIRVLGYDRLLEVERRLAGSGPLARLAVNRIYVCRLG